MEQNSAEIVHKVCKYTAGIDIISSTFGAEVSRGGALPPVCTGGYSHPSPSEMHPTARCSYRSITLPESPLVEVCFYNPYFPFAVEPVVAIVVFARGEYMWQV